MFCERCGTKIEQGEKFCPTCGNKVDTAAQTGLGTTYGSGINTSQLAGAVGSISTGANNLLLSALGAMMILWTFLPFVHVKLGKLAESLSGVLGSYLDEDLLSMVNMKYNLYRIESLIARFAPEYKGAIIAVIVFVVITGLLAIVAGVLNKKSLYYISGSVSAINLLMWIVYVAYIAYAIRTINNEIKSYIGDYAEFLGRSTRLITGVHGVGLVLLMITLAAYTVMAFRQALKSS